MSPKKSGCGCWSWVGIASLLLIGSWYIHRAGWFGKQLTPLEGAKIIPQEAILTGFISAEAQTWSELQQLGLPETEKLIRQGLNNFQQDFLDSTEVDYQQDIQPWFGGIMIAILPAQRSTQAEESILLVVGIKNKLKALSSISKIQQETEEDWRERKYKGITIAEVTDETNATVNSALLGSNLVVSNSKLAIEKAIDTYRGASSLASDPSAQEVLSQKLTLANPIAQVYFPNFDYLIEQISQENISAAALAEFQQLESVVLGIGIQPEGIHLQSITSLKTEYNQENADFFPTDSKILTKLPQNTIAALNGTNIQQIWSATTRQIETDRDLRRVLDMGRLSFRYGTGLDLDQDFFGWMDGEFVFSLMTSEGAIIPELGIGLEPAFIIETSQPEQAQASLRQIEKSFPRNAGIYARQKIIKNQQAVTEWIVPRSGLALTHGWVDKNYLVFSIGNSLLTSINNSTNSSFDRDAQFKAIAQKLPSNNLGYFYLDMNQVSPILSKINTRNPHISPEVMTLLKSLESIGATATMPDRSTNQLDVLLMFK